MIHLILHLHLLFPLQLQILIHKHRIPLIQQLYVLILHPPVSLEILDLLHKPLDPVLRRIQHLVLRPYVPQSRLHDLPLPVALVEFPLPLQELPLELLLRPLQIGRVHLHFLDLGPRLIHLPHKHEGLIRACVQLLGQEVPLLRDLTLKTLVLTC